MSLEKNILGIVPGLQSMALVGSNIKLMKHPNPKNFFKTGVTNLFGIGMIGATSSEIAKL